MMQVLVYCKTFTKDSIPNVNFEINLRVSRTELDLKGDCLWCSHNLHKIKQICIMKTQLNEPRVIHQTSKLFPNYFQITLLSSLRPAGWYHQLSRIYHGKQINISGDNKTKCIDNLDSYIVIHMKIQLYCKDSFFIIDKEKNMIDNIL